MLLTLLNINNVTNPSITNLLMLLNFIKNQLEELFG